MTSPGSVPVRWRPSLQAATLVVVAAVAVAGALLIRRVELLAVAAPSVWALLTGSCAPEATELRVSSDRRELRGREGEPGPLALELVADQPVGWLSARLALPPQLAGRVGGEGRDRTRLLLEGQVEPRRWGRHRLGPLRAELLDASGLRSAQLDLSLALDALVLPRPEPVRTASAPPLLPDRLGEHVTRARGHGIEPIGVRAFAAGDPVRRINWRVSSRRQALHVTVAAAERSVELVLVVDALSDVGAPPDTSLDRTVREAAGVAERWLRSRDAVGLLVLGGGLRWLTPAGGALQRQRIAEAVLWAWQLPGEIAPDVARVPRAVVPEGSVAIVLSPLLDERALAAVSALRRRAAHVLVVDTLGALEPEQEPGQVGALASRLWRLDRVALVERYRRSGVPVLQPGAGELDRLVALALRQAR